MIEAVKDGHVGEGRNQNQAKGNKFKGKQLWGFGHAAQLSSPIMQDFFFSTSTKFSIASICATVARM
jgi:hypothetical protein